MCTGIFTYRYVEHENKKIESDTQKALEFEYKTKRVHEGLCIEYVKQIEELIQMVAARFNMFKNNNFEIMYLNKRVSYFKDYSDKKPSLNPPFSSVYVCHNVLPRQIIFETIEK